MNTDIITILEIETIKNDFDETEQKITEVKETFAKVKSIGYNEFYQAQVVGMKPTFIFVLADYLDYNGERFIKYQNEIYTIVRTYKAENKNEIEITVSSTIHADSVFN